MNHNKKAKKIVRRSLLFAALLVAGAGLALLSPHLASAQQNSNPSFKVGGGGQGQYICGGGKDAVRISINIGCVQQGNAMVDAAFALLRFLSIGVGLVVIGSIVYGGIQYSAAKGDPNATSQAIKRIRSSVYALFIYIFGAAILNFLIPQGFFKL